MGPGRDGKRTLRAASQPHVLNWSSPPPPPVARSWTPRVGGVERRLAARWALRLALVLVLVTALGFALALLAVVDRAVFDAVNSIGYGADWVFELLDPHERIYGGLLLLAIIAAFALRGPWMALGVALALMGAATLSYLLLEVVALATQRSRPEEIFDAILKPPGVEWGQASYPSGHVTVTTAMAAAAAMALPALRWPMIVVIVVIAWSRVAFGAHFPLDVLAAVVVGYASAACSVAVTAAAGLLPHEPCSDEHGADAVQHRRRRIHGSR